MIYIGDDDDGVDTRNEDDDDDGVDDGVADDDDDGGVDTRTRSRSGNQISNVCACRQ